MDLKLQSEIKKLVYNRDLYHANYVDELEEFETKISDSTLRLNALSRSEEADPIQTKRILRETD